MHPLKLETILAAVAADEGSRTALRTAEALASAAGAKLHVIHVEHAEDGAAPTFDHASIERSDAYYHALQGEPASVLGRFANQVGASVIVVGPHRAGAGTSVMLPAVVIIAQSVARDTSGFLPPGRAARENAARTGWGTRCGQRSGGRGGCGCAGRWPYPGRPGGAGGPAQGG